jgi:hypothetical protein
MNKILFILLGVFFLLINGFADEQPLEITIDKFESNETSFSFEVTITNNSEKEYWFYYSGGKSHINVSGNVLYYSPNYSYHFLDSYFTSGQLQIIDAIKIEPHQEIKKTFHYANYPMKKVDLEEGKITMFQGYDFSEIDYLNATFVFIDYLLNPPISDSAYAELLFNDGYIVPVMAKRIVSTD